MRYGHPQQTQIVGCVPIGVGLVAASLAGEVLAPARPKTAAARATLARIVRPHDLDGNAGDVGLVLDACPKLKGASRAHLGDGFRLGSFPRNRSNHNKRRSRVRATPRRGQRRGFRPGDCR